MIGNKLEQSIIKVFEENLSETYSINSISKILKKSYPNINRKSHFLIKEGVLGKIDIGRSYQCYLNLANEKARIFLAIIEINKKDILVQKNPYMTGVIEEINQMNSAHLIQTAILYKKSLILVMSEKRNKDDIMEKTLLTQDFNVVFLNRAEFKELFLKNEDLQKYHYVLINAENYVNILSEMNDRFLLRAKRLKNLGNEPETVPKVNSKAAHGKDSRKYSAKNLNKDNIIGDKFKR